MTKPIIVVKICYKLLYVIQVVKKILISNYTVILLSFELSLILQLLIQVHKLSVCHPLTY